MNKESSQNLPKYLHVIGICGVATSALAIAFHKAGVKVTGSDKGFFPPVSTELEKHGIKFYAGWHPEKMIENGVPDLAVITTASGTQNPETLYVKEHNIQNMGYTEVFGKYFIRENSIVCAGTWGKTSSSSMLSFILDQAGFDPGYMFGGVSLSHESSAKITDGNWSVFEGDEYKSSPTDSRAKFFHYKPTHLLLTAVSWDHADLYPTEESYFDAFKKLVRDLPSSGLIVANSDQPGVLRVLSQAHSEEKSPLGARVITYGVKNADYTYDSVKQSEHGLSFTIRHDKDSFNITSPMIGAFQAENITGCFAMAHSIGIEPNKIISGIASFQGLKRRLEKRLNGEGASRGVTIFDDIAHSPEKASSVLRNLREIYKGKIIAIFEPNIGGRARESAAKYDGAFKDADAVIIPRLTKLKVAIDGSEAPMEGDELFRTISKTHPNCVYLEKDALVVNYLLSQTKKGDAIVFLGSHGFRGMIEETVEKLGK